MAEEIMKLYRIASSTCTLAEFWSLCLRKRCKILSLKW